MGLGLYQYSYNTEDKIRVIETLFESLSFFFQLSFKLKFLLQLAHL